MVLPMRTFVDPTSICGKEEQVSRAEYELMNGSRCWSYASHSGSRGASKEMDDDAAEEDGGAVVLLVGNMTSEGCFRNKWGFLWLSQVYQMSCVCVCVCERERERERERDRQTDRQTAAHTLSHVPWSGRWKSLIVVSAQDLIPFYLKTQSIFAVF